MPAPVEGGNAHTWVDAVLALVPKAKVYPASTFAEAEWIDERTKPTQEEVDTKLAELSVAWGYEQLREERNALLAETDWWANSDLTMTAEQTAYRQALRDITDSYTSLEDVVWPTKP